MTVKVKTQRPKYVGERQAPEVTYEAISSTSIPGPPGPSAYDIAVENGFSGSEDEWRTQYFKSFARDPEAMMNGAITRNDDGAITSAYIEWPDGTPGQFTATAFDATEPAYVNAYTITYGASPVIFTFTQPTVTRNDDGNVINAPAITVA